MKVMLIIFISILFTPIFSVESLQEKPVVILYHDGTGTIDLDDISTQPKTNRIVYHMLHVVLPNVYGINITMKPIKWTRGLKLIESGVADGIINASYNEERASYSVYPMKDGVVNPAKRLELIEYYLYKNKKSSITWDGEKIENIDGDIASVKSYSIINDFEKMGIQVEEETNIQGIIRNLSIGRFKAAALLTYTDFIWV